MIVYATNSSFIEEAHFQLFFVQCYTIIVCIVYNFHYKIHPEEYIIIFSDEVQIIGQYSVLLSKFLYGMKIRNLIFEILISSYHQESCKDSTKHQKW